MLDFEISLDNLALDGSLAFVLLAFGNWPTSNKLKAEFSKLELGPFFDCKHMNLFWGVYDYNTFLT